MSKFGFSISETASKIGVKPQQLRYWEKKITFFNPIRGTAHRTYSRKQVEMGLIIKRMIDEGVNLSKIDSYLNAKYTIDIAPGSESDVEIPLESRKVLSEIRDLRKQLKQNIAFIDRQLDS